MNEETRVATNNLLAQPTTSMRQTSNTQSTNSDENLENQLNVLLSLMTTLWANPLIREDEALLGFQLLEEAVLHLRSVKTNENWQRLHEKGVRMLDVILQAMIHVPAGVQVSPEVRLRACDIGEVLCYDYRRCGDGQSLIGVVRMYCK